MKTIPVSSEETVICIGFSHDSVVGFLLMTIGMVVFVWTLGVITDEDPHDRGVETGGLIGTEVFHILFQGIVSVM